MINSIMKNFIYFAARNILRNKGIFNMHLYYGIDYNIAKINKNMIYSNFQQIILQIIISFG